MLWRVEIDLRVSTDTSSLTHSVQSTAYLLKSAINIDKLAIACYTSPSSPSKAVPFPHVILGCLLAWSTETASAAGRFGRDFGSVRWYKCLIRMFVASVVIT